MREGVSTQAKKVITETEQVVLMSITEDSRKTLVDVGLVNTYAEVHTLKKYDSFNLLPTFELLNLSRVIFELLSYLTC